MYIYIYPYVYIYISIYIHICIYIYHPTVYSQFLQVFFTKSPPEETLFAAAGIPCRPFIPSKDPPGGGVAYCDINAEQSGILQNLDFLASLRRIRTLGGQLGQLGQLGLERDADKNAASESQMGPQNAESM